MAKAKAKSKPLGKRPPIGSESKGGKAKRKPRKTGAPKAKKVDRRRTRPPKANPVAKREKYPKGREGYLLDPEREKGKPGNRPGNLPDALEPYLWKKGDPSNPAKGTRGKRRAVSSIMKDMLDEPASLCAEIQVKAERLGLDPDRTSIGATLALAAINNAMAGRGSAFLQQVMDRVEGKVADRVLNVTDSALQKLSDEDLLRIIGLGKPGSSPPTE